jgi:hypothetical protein
MLDDSSAIRLSFGRCVVGGSVAENQDFGLKFRIASYIAQMLDDTTDRLCFVVGGNDNRHGKFGHDERIGSTGQRREDSDETLRIDYDFLLSTFYCSTRRSRSSPRHGRAVFVGSAVVAVSLSEVNSLVRGAIGDDGDPMGCLLDCWALVMFVGIADASRVVLLSSGQQGSFAAKRHRPIRSGR